jgi:hypothetical protein
VHDKVYKDEDLLIKVIPLNEESDPDIYISKVRDRVYKLSYRARNIQCLQWIVTGSAHPMARTRVPFTIRI